MTPPSGSTKKGPLSWRDAWGLGDWTFDNVYSYVYEEAVTLDPAGHDLAFQIQAQDYRAHLEAPVQAEASK